MRILTIFTVILPPLTWIVGIYGMNGFDLNEPGTFPAGFIILIILMACISGGLFAFFVSKRWLLVREEDRKNEVHTEDRTPPQSLSGKGHVEYHIFKRK